MSSPFNLAQFVDATNLAIQKIVLKEAEPELMLKKYYNFRTTEDLIEKDSSISGLREAEFTDENSTIAEDVPVQGFDMSLKLLSSQIVMPQLV